MPSVVSMRHRPITCNAQDAHTSRHFLFAKVSISSAQPRSRHAAFIRWMNSTAVYDSRRDRTLVLQNDIIWALESGSGERHHGPREDAVERQNQAPGPVVLDLRGACPNPSAGAILAQFTLPDASPASLELLDVAGRRLWTEDVGELGGGSHVVQVNPARTLTPGLYLLRLTRGSTSLTRKKSGGGRERCWSKPRTLNFSPRRWDGLRTALMQSWASM